MGELIRAVLSAFKLADDEDFSISVQVSGPNGEGRKCNIQISASERANPKDKEPEQSGP